MQLELHQLEIDIEKIVDGILDQEKHIPAMFRPLAIKVVNGVLETAFAKINEKLAAVEAAPAPPPDHHPV